jgi:hypothetical protein
MKRSICKKTPAGRRKQRQDGTTKSATIIKFAEEKQNHENVRYPVWYDRLAAN